MAKNDKNKQNQKRSDNLNSMLGNIQDVINKIYTGTHFANRSNSRDLDNIKKDINKNIDDIINHNITSIGEPNISKLYSRLLDKKGLDNTEASNIDDLFNDKAISNGFMSTIDQTRSIMDYDEEINEILKYMPQLIEALESKKDNVLSTDQYSKDYLNCANETTLDNNNEFVNRIKDLKKKYNLLYSVDSYYDNVAKYGEEFVYCMPYRLAMAQLLNIKNNNPGIIPSMMNESSIETDCLSEATINLQENYIVNTNNKKYNINESFDLGNDNNVDEIKIKFDTSGIIRRFYNEQARTEQIISSLNEAKFSPSTVPNDVEFDSLDTTEGLIDTEKKNINSKNIKTPGCIVRRLSRQNVIPIYIESLCLGYYYIEGNNDELFKNINNMAEPMLSSRTRKDKYVTNMDAYEKSLKSLSGKLSEMIDDKFINANYDLRNEMYMLLRHALYSHKVESVLELTVTYIPPEYMFHFNFKLNDRTHRGISDLDKAIVPAKMWIALTTSATLGILTRGYDRRVYYVKQTVDTNISQVMLNTINQIKKSNMGMREFNSIKNVLSIQGRYNDMVIPMGASGDSPIQMEIMNGQNIDIKTDLMDIYEHNAIEATDVPYDYVMSRQQVDFAIRLTMSNGKFLRKTFKRQSIWEGQLSRFISFLYNNEYDTNDSVKVMLPPPAFLALANTTQMMDTMDQYVDKLLPMVLTPQEMEDQSLTQYIKSKLMQHYVSTHVDMAVLGEISKKGKIEYTKYKTDENN